MTKLLQILLLSVLFFTFGCEGPIGPKGEDGLNGEDGVSNIQTIYTEITSNNIEFIGNASDGYIVHKLDTDLINSSVVDSGYVVVEISTSNDPYLWSPLPQTNFVGFNGDLSSFFLCDFSYEVGHLHIKWETTYSYNLSEWLSEIGMWGVYYKVTIVSPS